MQSEFIHETKYEAMYIQEYYDAEEKTSKRDANDTRPVLTIRVDSVTNAFLIAISDRFNVSKSALVARILDRAVDDIFRLELRSNDRHKIAAGVDKAVGGGDTWRKNAKVLDEQRKAEKEPSK
jgi:hypothetical protein